jgi:MFS family permease
MRVTETTLFATIPMIVNISFQMFVWGTLSDKYQLRRTFVVIGEILAGFGTLIVFFAHRLVDTRVVAGWIIIICLSVVEIFWSMSNNGWSALISDLVPFEERSAIQGRLSSVGGLGRIFGVWIGGLLYDGLQLQYEGWGFYEGSLFFVAAFVMFLSAIPMLFVPEGGINNKFEPKLEENKEELPQRSDLSSSSKQIFIIFLIAITFINFGRNSIATILPQYLFLPKGFAISSELLSYVVNTQSVAIILLGFFVGWIGLKLGNGNTILLGAFLSIIALFLFVVSTDLSFIFFASFLRGASQVIIMASSYAFASGLINPKDRAKLFSVFNATFFLSWGLSGTFISGPITDLLILGGTDEILAFKATFLVSTLITLIGLIILTLLLIWIRTQSDKENKIQLDLKIKH